MEGRFPTGILLALTNCNDPSREDEFNQWYDEYHLPDLQSTGLLSNAARFVNADPRPGQPNYVAIYETFAEDIVKAREDFAELRAKIFAANRMTDLGDMAAWGIFQGIGSTSTASPGRPVGGLLINSQNSKDPSRAQEFSDWYSTIHVPDVLGSGLYHSAYRYQNDEPGDVLGQFINIYETHLDPMEASDGLRGERDKWEATGHTNDLLEIKFRIVVRPVHPKS